VTKQIMVVYGTRPEAIKVAPIIRELQASSRLKPILTVTGQHREMLDQVNALFGFTPDHDLDIMVPGASLNDLASRAMVGVSKVLEQQRPDALLVQGDTSTAFIAGLSAFYQQVPVIHLEAGLRTGTIHSPFPEEANRRLLSPLASLHLAPTAVSKENLVKEQIPADSIVITGNTVIDALRIATSMPVRFTDPALQKVVDQGRRLGVVTAHRRESWGNPMDEAMAGLAEVAKQLPDVTFVVALHRNPIVREVIEPRLGHLENVILTEPLSYHEFCHAMKAAEVMLTDSGGVQEEAPSLGKPVLVMRESTERPEAVTAGTVQLVGTDKTRIVDSLTRLLTDQSAYEEMARAVNPYGDGLASKRSIAAIEALFNVGERMPDFDPEESQ